jgi:hypothetical protein
MKDLQSLKIDKINVLYFALINLLYKTEIHN